MASRLDFSQIRSLYIGTSASQTVPTNNVIIDGNVLLGTTTDTGLKLDVNGSARLSGGLLYLGNYSANPEIILQASANSWSKINFYDNNNTEGLYIRTDGDVYGGTMTFGARWDDDEGKVFFKMFQSSAGATYDVKIGVNTGSPETMFHLDKSSSSNDISGTPSIIISNKDSTSGTFVSGGIFNNPYRDVSTSSVTAGVWFENQNSPDAGAAAKSSAVVFGANSYSTGWALPTERMRITQGGDVGIGTAQPLGPLEVYRSATGALGGHIIVNNNGTAVGNETALMFGDGGINAIRAAISCTTEGSPYKGELRFKSGATAYSGLDTNMVIKGNGNVLIGTTTDAGYKLAVNGSAGLALSSGGIVVASYDGNTGNIKPSVANGSVLISDDSGTVGRGTEFLNNGGFIASTTQSLVSSFNSSIQDTLVYTRVTATQQTTTSGTSPAAIELVGLRGDSTHGRHAWIGAEGVDSTTFRTKLLFKIRGESNSGYLWSGASEAPTILAVDGNGFVGINNSSPTQALDVQGIVLLRNSGFTFASLDGNTNQNLYITANAGQANVSPSIIFRGSTSGGSVIEHARIAPSGYLGVGTDTPLSKLDVSLASGQALFIANEAGTISDGDLLGAVSFGSRDGSTYSSGGITNIRSYATATYNTGSVSGDMRFYVSSSLQNTTQAALFGQEAMRITAGGNVLIGTTTDAGYKLDVNGTFRSQGFLNVQGGYYENKQLYVQAGETKYLYVDIENSWGNVDVLIAGYGSAGSASCLISWIDGGHGGGTPYHRLIQLARQTQGNPVLGNVIQTGAGGAISIQNTGGVVITLQVTTRSYGSSSVAANVYLSDTAPTGNNASILNIDDINSRVGIGTTSPAQILHVSNASAVFQITDTNKTANNSLWIQALSQTAWGIGTANNASSGTKMVIMDNGNIGFGVSSSSSRLDVIGAGNTLSGTAAYQVRFLEDQTNYRGILLGYDTSGSIGIIAADTAAPASTLAFWTYSGSAWGERMRLNGSGNLLIGTTTDNGYKLNVNGSIQTFGSINLINNDIYPFFRIGSMTCQYPYNRMDSVTTDGSGYFWGFGMVEGGVNKVKGFFRDGTPGFSSKGTLDVITFDSNEFNASYPTITVGARISSSGVSYFSGGNVGIGGSSPARLLTVYTGDPNGSTTPATNTAILIDSAANQYLEFRTASASSGYMQGLLFTDNGRNGFIGFKEYTNAVAGTYGESIHFSITDYSGSDAGSGFYFGTSTNNENGVTTPLVFLRSNGNMMIGTTTDAGYKLDVNGVVRAQTYFVSAENVTNDGLGPYNWIYLGPGDAGATRASAVQIGDVPGAKYAIACGGYDLEFYKHVSTGSWALAYKLVASGLTDSTPDFQILYSLAVGNINPSGTTGRIDASNDIVAYSSSDRRLKENIKPIENALDKVKSLTGVEFDWKAEHKEAHGYEGHDTGVIAQEVQEVMPTAVRTNDTGYLAVRYEKLIGLLIEANKELAKRVEDLESKLK